MVLGAGLAGGVVFMLAGVLSAVISGTTGHRALGFGDLRHGLAEGDPTALMSVGILLLIATPAARVILLGVAFARLREWAFLAASVVVLAVLALGVILGLRG